MGNSTFLNGKSVTLYSDATKCCLSTFPLTLRKVKSALTSSEEVWCNIHWVLEFIKNNPIISCLQLPATLFSWEISSFEKYGLKMKHFEAFRIWNVHTFGFRCYSAKQFLAIFDGFENFVNTEPNFFRACEGAFNLSKRQRKHVQTTFRRVGIKRHRWIS